MANEDIEVDEEANDIEDEEILDKEDIPQERKDKEELVGKSYETKSELDEDVGDEELLNSRKTAITEIGEELIEDFDLNEKDILPGWEIKGHDGIIRVINQYEFDTMEKAADFIVKVAKLARNLHPPTINFEHNNVSIEIHSTGAGFSEDELKLIKNINSLH